MSPSVMMRSLMVAFVVGSLLALINHGDAIFMGVMTPDRWMRVGLTYVVPYVVATYGAVGVFLDNNKGSSRLNGQQASERKRDQKLSH
ncbi:MAG: nitrate/nitrite transporter NrtS [Pseudomonadota bacterium]